MLIKEYRIPLPLTVDEYRIAQLYMIAKKSRDESSGAGSGVEIIINEPYENGPGGNGQYTKKIYHIGSHLPGWVKGLLPKSALTVEEQAWNAYPYTKTRYTCPFVEKFSLDIETYYFPDDGNQENVFALTGGDLRNRVVDLIDVVKEQPTGADYIRSEDPTLFMSEKTNRGPLNENWLGEYWNEVKGKKQPTAKNMSLMCAYKLCRVEFRYWGMQTKLEKFIHDIALRKTMLRAHRQAWAWQDEWHGLTIEDIREIERQTQLALQRKFGDGDEDDDNSEIEIESNKRANQMSSIEKTEETPMFSKKVSQPIVSLEPTEKDDSSDEEETTISKPVKMDTNISSLPEPLPTNQNKITDINQHPKTKFESKDNALHSPIGSTHSFDLQVANWRMEKLEVDSKSGSEEEFFDCLDMGESTSLAKWSSLELLPEEDDSPPANSKNDDSIFSQSYLQRVASERGSRRSTFGHATSVDRSYHESPPSSPSVPSCPTSILILVFHAGSVLDTVVDKIAKKSDVTTFRGAFESIMRQHYPSLVGHVIIKLVSCPSVSMDAVGIVSSLSPYSFELSATASDTHKAIDLPLGAIPLLACSCTTDIHEYVNKAVIAGNAVYNEFLKSEDGRDFNGQVVLIGDSMGSILAFDAICRSNSNNGGGRHGSEGSGLDDDHLLDNDVNKLLLAPSPRRRSSSIADSRLPKFDFEVSDFFIFGSPLGFVLAARRVIDSKCGTVKPHCSQIYNLFHPTDPNASRLEPLISARFSMLSPVNVPRYGKFPLGNGQPCHLLELIHSNPQIFHDIGGHHRRSSDTSMQSNVSGLIDNIPLTTISNLQQRWWGIKRLDYAFYCPEGLNTFPVQVLPHLFHGSYWESTDVIAFVLRQLARFDSAQSLDNEEKESSSFNPGQPTEKWIKKRTSVKLKNVAANHRANDVIAREGEPQKLTGRFMYGPFDMITLAGEKVDVHIMKEPPVGEWVLVSTEVSDKTGRVSYTIPEDKSLGFGIYPIKMVVRGDHTSLDFYLAVIPPRTECVVFSIDGSFTASMSVTGKDPKVRAGAVDICRHWQELGYLLIYITGRPDMQQQRVLSWLSQHNFPHGLISFADGISTDPLGHKTAYLNSLIQNHSITICAAYGSSKDITVYTNIGLKPKQIYIVGKVTKKLQTNATVLAEGYTAHLNVLTALGGCRPAHGNQRMVIPRGCFNLPGQTPSIRRRRLHEPEVN